MIRCVFVIALLAACGTDEAPLEFPSEVVHCGGGPAGVLRGEVTGPDGQPIALGTVVPAWHRGSEDGPGLITIVPGDPLFELYAWGDTMSDRPIVGAQPARGAFIVTNGNYYPAQFQGLVIDESTGDGTTDCVAGRFDETYDKDLHGRLVGWFRTQ